jgi:hypothetical protein
MQGFLSIILEKLVLNVVVWNINVVEPSLRKQVNINGINVKLVGNGG